MGGNGFNPLIKPKMNAERYIKHLKNVHEMSKDAGIPMGPDVLFKKPAIYTDNEYSAANRVPLEPELKTEDTLTIAKIRAYEDF